MNDRTSVPQGWKWIRREIHRLDPRDDCERIVSLLYDWRFSDPMSMHFFVTVGFCRQVAVPEMAEIIYRHGTGKQILRPGPRGDDTMRMFGEWFRYGPTSAEGGDSLTRLNRIHGRFPITNDQLLFTLATVCVFPNMLFHLVGAPGLDQHEQTALAHFWIAAGERMEIEGIPDSYAGFLRYAEEYERTRFRPSEAGTRCADALVGDFATRWFPPRLQGVGRTIALAHFDDRLRRMFALRYPNRATTAAIRAGTRARIALQDRILPDPRRPRYVVDSFTTRRGQRPRPDREARGPSASRTSVSG